MLELALGLPGNARSITSGLMAGPNDPPEGPAFLIPAGAKGHEEKMVITLGDSVAGGAWVVTAGTHMHYVGTGMKSRSTAPTGWAVRPRTNRSASV